MKRLRRLLLAIFILYFIPQAFRIPAASMADTLLVGDHIFVNKFIYGLRGPFTDHRVLKFRKVRRGEIIVFEVPPLALSQEERQRHAKKVFTKRVVGLPGDEIRIKNKRIYVNGLVQNEAYASYRDPMIIPEVHPAGHQGDFQKLWEKGDLAQQNYVRDNFGPVIVPSESYFVLGDNRDGSFDSRFWGPMPDPLLRGKVWMIYWPLERIRIVRS